MQLKRVDMRKWEDGKHPVARAGGVYLIRVRKEFYVGKLLPGKHVLFMCNGVTWPLEMIQQRAGQIWKIVIRGPQV